MKQSWLEKATSKNHPRYAEVHGNFAADGFRAHRDNSLPAVDDELTRYASVIIPTQPRNRATVSRADLVIAVKRAKALRDDSDRRNGWTPALRFSMNGSFTYTATNESTGTINGEIVDGMKFIEKIKPIKNGLKYITHTMVYRHNTDKPVEFQLNPEYLEDALSGMEGDTVEIDIPVHNAPFYITDGVREAAIMPIAL